MRRLTMGIIAGVGAVAGSAAMLAYRVSQETGRSLTDSVKEVPAEAQRYWEELRMRGEEAFQAGKQAAKEKQAEIEEQLRK
ncbi:MAG: hypothetical protein Kow00129_11830 [Thermoleophilia bacterium]